MLRSLLLLLTTALLCSCGGGSASSNNVADLGASGGDGGKATEQKKSMLDRFTTTYAEATAQKDSKGRQASKRSSFDSRSEFSGLKAFDANKRASSYTSKEWGGARDAQVKRFQGNTDGSRFLEQRFQGRDAVANAQGQQSRLQGQNYSTGEFETGAARERSRNSRNVSQEQRSYYSGRQNAELGNAPVFSLRDYQQRSIEQTRSMMGRSE